MSRISGFSFFSTKSFIAVFNLARATDDGSIERIYVFRIAP